MLKKCKDCYIVKPWVLKHSYDNGNVYADDKGALWRGSRCPDCFAGAKQSLKKELTHRKCRICNCILSKSRYFNCLECIKKEELDHDATGYNAIGEVYI